MNIVTLTGNLGQNPEITNLQSGHTVAKFSLATSDGFGDNKKTNWHRIVCWNKTAELAEKYLSKGSKVGIVGRIEYGSYENKNGDKVYTTDIVVNQIEFLDSKNQDTITFESKDSAKEPERNEGDLPF